MKPPEGPASVYALLYPRLQAVARERGYALALHGSLGRDMDLVALPWIENCAAPLEVADAIRGAANGVWRAARPPLTADKPHGRLTALIDLPISPYYIDLSIFPPR